MINYTSTLLLGLSEEMGGTSFSAPAKWAFWQAGLSWGLEESRMALSSILGAPGAAAQLSRWPWAPDCAWGQRKHLTKSRQQTQTGARAALPWGALAGLPAPLLQCEASGCVLEPSSPGRSWQGPVSGSVQAPGPLKCPFAFSDCHRGSSEPI